HGHNETDEPSFTQPLLYKAIASRPSVRESYLEHLLALGGFTREEAERIAVQRREHLEQELGHARQASFESGQSWLHGYWQGYQGGPEADVEDVVTSLDPSELGRLLTKTTELPEGFAPHPKLARLLDQRRSMANGERPWDWGAAELGVC